jgi:AcrR family transcriptional regulator
VGVAAQALKSQTQDGDLIRSRRHQIFLAACRVLARKSFHEASVKEIALEAGIAAGSIYVYLKTKDDILFLIAESMVTEFTEMLPAIRVHAQSDPRRELMGLVRAVVEIIDRYREAFAVLHHEVRYIVDRPEYAEVAPRVAEQYGGPFADVLRRGKRLGLFRFHDLRAAIYALQTLCSGWATGSRALSGISKEAYLREIESIVEGRLFARAVSRGRLAALLSSRARRP